MQSERRRVRKKIYEFDSIGTHWWCEILDNTSYFTNELIAGIEAICETFDRRYSRFRDDSLIAELYRTGSISNPPQEMVSMFTYAHELYDISDGLFDIGVGATLHTLGYGSREKGSELKSSIWNEISISADEIKAPKGVMIDFGGQGKGWLIDSIVAYLREQGLSEFIVNGGGDMYVASSAPVKIILEDPNNPRVSYGHAYLQNQSLAASSVTKRTWQLNGEHLHHIIDPRTRKPAYHGARGTFVKATTATIADTLATVMIINPDLKTRLEQRFNAQIIIVS